MLIELKVNLLNTILSNQYAVYIFLMIATAFPVGFFAGLFGIGGGLITVPFLFFIFDAFSCWNFICNNYSNLNGFSLHPQQTWLSRSKYSKNIWPICNYWSFTRNNFCGNGKNKAISSFLYNSSIFSRHIFVNQFKSTKNK